MVCEQINEKLKVSVSANFKISIHIIQSILNLIKLEINQMLKFYIFQLFMSFVL